MNYPLQFLQGFAIALVVAVASITAAFVAADRVEQHIDATIAQTVKSSSGQTAAAKKLFQQVNTICDTLKKQSSNINCE